MSGQKKVPCYANGVAETPAGKLIPLSVFLSCALVTVLLSFQHSWAYITSWTVFLLAVAIGLIIYLHVLTPNLDPIDHFVSEYSNMLSTQLLQLAKILSKK